MAQRGISIEQLLAARGISQEDWIKEMMGSGLFEARLEVLYKSIAKAEGITVSDKEVDDAIASEAPSQKLKPKQLKAQMQKNGSMEMLEYSLLMDKVQKFLFEKAQVTYVKPGEAEEEKPAAKKSSKAKKSAEEPAEAAEGEEAATQSASKKKAKADTAEGAEETAAEKPKKAKSSKKASKAAKSEE